MSEERICFVIAPIGNPQSETRKRSDQVLRYIIEPAVGERGYTAVRADKIAKPGIITSQVIQHILEDPLVLADLTEHNPNVFYELAVRHAIRKPLVQIIEEGQDIPFDLAQMRTIRVDHHELASANQAKIDIVEQVKALEEDSTQVETPISLALDLQSLRRSGDPGQRSLGELVSAISELQNRIGSMDRRLHQPEALLPPGYIAHAVRTAGARWPSAHAFDEIYSLVDSLHWGIMGPDLSPSEKEELAASSKLLKGWIARLENPSG